jgi:hypothetical protein
VGKSFDFGKWKFPFSIGVNTQALGSKLINFNKPYIDLKLFQKLFDENIEVH